LALGSVQVLVISVEAQPPAATASPNAATIAIDARRRFLSLMTVSSFARHASRLAGNVVRPLSPDKARTVGLVNRLPICAFARRDRLTAFARARALRP
jgi:hypothetical protein